MNLIIYFLSFQLKMNETRDVGWMLDLFEYSELLLPIIQPLSESLFMGDVNNMAYQLQRLFVTGTIMIDDFTTTLV